MRGYHVYNDIWEASTEEQLLNQRENGNRADPRLLFRVEREVLGPFSFGCASAFYTSQFSSVPQPSHAGQLEIGDSVDQGHCK